MAYDGSIKIDTALDGNGFQSGLAKIGGIAKSALGGLVTIIGGVGAALSSGALAGVKYNAQMEQYMTSFATMLGSADRATSMVSDLKKFAAATPFEFSDLAKGSQTLLAFGISADKLQPALKMLGDVSQGNTDKFNSLSLAFGQVSSAGKMTGQDLMQFINAGFNPLQVMAKKSGKSMAELRAEMEKGQISAEDVAQAFQDATSKGGQFYDAMESQSKTFNGQLSTLKDNAMQFLGDITQGFTDSLKDTAMPMVNGWMTQLADAFKSGGVSGVVSALGTVLAQVAGEVSQQAPGIIDMAVNLLIAFVNGIADNSDKIADAAVKIVEALISGIGKLLPRLVDAGKKILDSLLSSLGDAYPQIKPLTDALGTIVDNMDKVLAVVVPIAAAFVAFKAAMAISGLITAAKVALDGMTISQLAMNAAIYANPVGLIIAGIAALIAGIVYLWNTNEGFRNALLSAWGAISAAVSVVWGVIVNFFTVTLPNAWTSVVAFFQGIPAWWSGLWAQVGQFFSDCWNGIISFFTTTIPAWIQSVVDWFNNLPNEIGYAIGLLLGHIVQFGIDAWNWVTTELPMIIDGIVQWFSELPGKIWAWLLEAIAKITDWINNATTIVKTEVPKFIDSVVGFFKELPGKIWTWLSNAIQKVIQWGSDMEQKAKEGVRRVIDGIVEWFKDLPDKMMDIGKNIVHGIWDGITGAVQWLKDKIGGFCNGILQGFRDSMEIGSPSKLMADEVGEFLPPGIPIGMKRVMPSTIRDIKSQMAAMMAKAQTAISDTQARLGTTFAASSNYQVALAGGYGAVDAGDNPAANGGTVHYTFNSPKALSLREIRQEMLLAEQRQKLIGR